MAGPMAAPDAAARADAAGGSLAPSCIVALYKSSLKRAARFSLDAAWGQAEAMATDGVSLFVATYHGNAVLIRLDAVTLEIVGGRDGALQMGLGRVSSICMDSSRLYAVAEGKGKLQVYARSTPASIAAAAAAAAAKRATADAAAASGQTLAVDGEQDALDKVGAEALVAAGEVPIGLAQEGLDIDLASLGRPSGTPLEEPSGEFCCCSLLRFAVALCCRALLRLPFLLPAREAHPRLDLLTFLRLLRACSCRSGAPRRSLPVHRGQPSRRAAPAVDPRARRRAPWLGGAQDSQGVVQAGSGRGAAGCSCGHLSAGACDVGLGAGMCCCCCCCCCLGRLWPCN